jgi:hypothetical protein
MSSENTIRNVQQVPAGTPAKAVHRHIETDGGVILKGLFSKQVDRLNAELDPIVNEWAEGVEGNDWMKEFSGYKTKRVTQLIARSKVFREEMLDDPTMLSYVDTLMLETSDSYWMNAAQVIQLQPGEKAQFLHRDLENGFSSLWPDSSRSHVQLHYSFVGLHGRNGRHTRYSR